MVNIDYTNNHYSFTHFFSTVGKHLGRLNGHFQGPETFLLHCQNPPHGLLDGRKWLELTAWTQLSVTQTKIKNFSPQIIVHHTKRSWHHYLVNLPIIT